ncbi:MAG: hypothetical protein DRJ31_10750 [Candidatus Methanomethylicota archaeon]|uniref:Uncharacterized protein n=1 Tax=Thermoproteota archaeon TaxID=2056631 RepID=A0A497EXM5_9CREN|nr:MAG: hypothetical protein DRJ31_10750 [Candidatus Verstraetearchaeota archaeon]RLE51965.1 MAG: hypothetical protein DRJ33_04795 [Candidatus Verstraetearchaeota archaeon]
MSVEKAVLSSSHLAELFNKCIETLEKEGDPIYLYDLTILLGVIAKAKDDALSYAIQPFIGMLGPELDDFFVMIRYLPQNVQGEFREAFNKVVSEVASSLKKIREELYEKSEPDHKSLLEALGSLGKTLSALYEYKDKAERHMPSYPPY